MHARFPIGSKVFILVCLLVGVRPFIKPDESPPAGLVTSLPWPSHFMGEALSPIRLTRNEQAFYRDFPGEAAQFQTASERLILRRVELATRKLHPAEDCFRGMGYRIVGEDLRRDGHERIWRSFNAVKNGERLEVMELITDASGNSWSDVSAWYWAVLMEHTKGPWVSYVRVRNADG